jgi:plasmid stabilization system protein ParE
VPVVEPIWLHPEAIAEGRAARVWYAARSPEAADAFMVELDLAIRQIDGGPRHWPLYLGGTRRYLLHRFPFFIVFRETSTRIEVVAIAHARRQPGYWFGR